MKNVVKILKDIGEAVVMLVLMTIGMIVLVVVGTPLVVMWLLIEVVKYVVEYEKCKSDNRGDMRGEATTEDSASDSDEY